MSTSKINYKFQGNSERPHPSQDALLQGQRHLPALADRREEAGTGVQRDS